MTRLFPPFQQASKTQAGFALLEVLIAILVLTVGLIGAAMMQLHAARTTEQSNLHDTALALAMQIADELRANDTEARKPGTAGSINPFLPFDWSVGSSIISGVDCYASLCSTAELAVQSKKDWESRAQLSLPGGHIEICRDATVTPPSTASLTWCGSGSASAAAIDIPIVIKIGWNERDANGRSVADLSPRVAVLVSPFSQ